MEDVSKFAVGVHDYNTCNSCAKEDILKEATAEMGTVMFLNGGDNDGRAEIVHGA